MRVESNTITGAITSHPNAPLPPPLTQDELDYQDSDKAKQELIEIDSQSIRDIRKWIASQPDASKELKDYETLAIAARGRIK
jgi:hypothetical protein